MKDHKKRRVEASKKIIITLFVLFSFFALAGLLLAWFRGDSQVLVILAGGLISAMDVAIGFYYWKARKENEIKLGKLYGVLDPPEREKSEGV